MIHLVLLGLLVGLATCSTKSEAAQSSISYLHGDGYVSGDNTRNTVRIDTLAIKDWGLLYGRADVLSFDDSNSSISTRGIGHYGHGLHLAGQLQNQKGVSQSSAGVGYSSFSKDSSWFVDVYKMQSNYYGDSIHWFNYYSRNLGENYKATGFIEYIKPENKNLEPVTFSQASILRKVSNVWVGVEHQRYFNKGSVKGLDESVNQLLIKWDF
jgi:hypothetical protein